jgi:hypothetical protein
VVLPIWLASPAAAAFLWRDLDGVALRLVTLGTAAVLSIGAAWLLWVAFDPSACETSPRTPAEGLIVPSTFVGLVIGVGWAACGLMGRQATKHGRRSTAVAGVVALAIGHLILVVGSLTYVVLSFGGCNRPGTV